MTNTSRAPFDFIEAAIKLNDDLYLDLGLQDMLGQSRFCEVCDGDFGPAFEWVSPFSHCGGSMYLCRECAISNPEGEFINVSEVKIDYSDLGRDVFLDNLIYLHQPWTFVDWRYVTFDPLQKRYSAFASVSQISHHG